MKKFTPSFASLLIEIIMLLGCNFLINYIFQLSDLGLLNSILAFSILNFFVYLLLSGGDHYFMVMSDRLVIKSRLRPWVNDTVFFSDIKEVSWASKLKVGNLLYVTERTLGRVSWGTNLSGKQLIELVGYLSQKIKS